MANRLPRHKIRPRHLSVCTLVDNWSSRADLRPCQPVVQEDLATRVGKSTASIIDGKSISKQIRQEIAEEIRKMKHKRSKVPELAFILVGNRKDSELYVNLKRKACEEVGIRSSLVHLSEETREEELVQHIQRFNLNSDVHGVLVQLPLPLHISEDKVVSAINIEKDVDGLHPMNLGRLAVQKSEPLFLPCASRACIELLVRTGVHIRAKHVIVIGNCTLIGKPTALLLHRYDATVTVVHSFTPNPADITRKGDIVIAAAGVPHLVRDSWLKPGAFVLDMSSNQIADPFSPTGYRVVGDVCYHEACAIASAITPVPGGMGPITITMLLQNTLKSFKRAIKFEDA